MRNSGKEQEKSYEERSGISFKGQGTRKTWNLTGMANSHP